MHTTLKFLNLDLDFFISDIVYTPRGLVRRANKKRYHTWPQEDLRNFLEQRCGLSRCSRVPGHFGIHHDEVFDYWRSLMPDSSAKLDIVHVDAHGDFAGAIDTGVFGYLQEQLLAYPTKERLDQIDLNRKRLTLANYMSFAVACRWIERIEFVTHPMWKPKTDPYPSFFRNGDPSSGLLELRRTRNGKLIAVEPPVGYRFTAGTAFSQAGFSKAFLCQSPNYTPSTADALIPIFREYIDFDSI